MIMSIQLKDAEMLVPQVSVLNILKMERVVLSKCKCKTNKRKRKGDWVYVYFGRRHDRASRENPRSAEEISRVPHTGAFLRAGTALPTSRQPCLKSFRCILQTSNKDFIVQFIVYICAIGSWPLFVRRFLVVLFLAAKVVKWVRWREFDASQHAGVWDCVTQCVSCHVLCCWQITQIFLPQASIKKNVLGNIEPCVEMCRISSHYQYPSMRLMSMPFPYRNQPQFINIYRFCAQPKKETQCNFQNFFFLSFEKANCSWICSNVIKFLSTIESTSVKLLASVGIADSCVLVGKCLSFPFASISSNPPWTSCSGCTHCTSCSTPIAENRSGPSDCVHCLEEVGRVGAWLRDQVGQES